jgi:predicted CXXCH cytochrome family protein
MEVAHAGYRILESQCFQKSAGRLRCTTCHDPHRVFSGQAAAARYDGVCVNCHQASLSRMMASGTHTADSACVSCHMPKRRTDEAVHIVMTDHLIRRVPVSNNLLAEKDVSSESPAEPYRGEVVLYYPAQLPPTAANTLDVAVAQIRDRSNLKEGLPHLAGLIEQYRPAAPGYYADLAEGYLAVHDDARAIASFEEAVRHVPESAAMWLRFGRAMVEAGRWERAETILRRITGPRGNDPMALGLLGQALSQQGKIPEAKLMLQRATDLDPDLPDLHNHLGSLLARSGDWGGAEKEFRAALRIEPGVAEWHTNLANLLTSEGKADEARYHFELSIRLKPGYARSRLGYARLLADANHREEAEAQVKKAVEADGAMAEAHELWGYLLAAKPDLDGAERELETAVRLAPNFWRAHYELGAVLGRKGEARAARAHLQIAAQGKDTEVQRLAQGLLQTLGQ